MEKIDLFAFARGDTSVGIPNAQWTVENIGPLDAHDGQREAVRQAFSDAFGKLADGKVEIRFSDELEAEQTARIEAELENRIDEANYYRAPER